MIFVTSPSSGHGALNSLLYAFSRLWPHQISHLLSGGIEEHEGGLADEAVFSGQRLALITIDIHVDYTELALVLLFEPIHDGRHFFADRSPLGVEVEHVGTVRDLDGTGVAGSRKDTAGKQEQSG